MPCSEGTLLQSTCQAKELLYWIMPSCEQNRKTADIAGTNWATFTTVLGWPVKGIWPEGSARAFFLPAQSCSCDVCIQALTAQTSTQSPGATLRALFACVHVVISLGSSRSGRLLASGDDFGCVKVRASGRALARVAPRLRPPVRFFAFLPSPAAKNFAEMSGTAHTSCELHHVLHHTCSRVHYGMSCMRPACLSHPWPGVFGSLQLISAFAVMLANGCSVTARAGMS